MEIVALSAFDDDQLDLVGGKAVGLGKLIKSGERVPDGFCVTTETYRSDRIPAAAVLSAYRELGGGPVAVRSSATAEDLPDASFAGVQETVLGVQGGDALLAAIRTCWASLQSPRAIAYREARGHAGGPAAMAVIVQRMIDPVAAGVTFTANPITGTRTELVIDAVPGLGTGVVDGTGATDHYELHDGDRPAGHGCLSLSQLEELRQAGRRIERDLGAPQDLEWAYDRDGLLWQLQARPITTLFPVPDEDGRGLRVFLEVGHLQGLRAPVTPMGMSVLTRAADHWFEAYGLSGARDAVVSIAGRMFLDLTFMFRDRRFRPRIPAMLEIYGPGVAGAATRLLEDPRLAPETGRKLPLKSITKIAAKMVPGLLTGSVAALIMPARARRQARRLRDQAREAHAADDRPADAAGLITAAANAQDWVLGGPMMALLPPLYAGLSSSRIAAALLGPIAGPGEIDATQRGMPYNVTTEMDLRLWQVAQSARAHRDLFRATAPVELSRRFRAGELPEIGLGRFLESYGHRGAAEIDVGVARWAEDPAPLFAAIAGYLRVEDPEQGPDVRFARAAAEAEQSLDLLVGRALRTRPLRGALAGWLLRRSRALAGLRELPKFIWLFPLQTVRQHLQEAGAELTRRGRLAEPDDLWFLTLEEAAAAAAGTDQRSLAAARRADHLRESRRPRVPGVLLSDGTMPENLPSAASSGEEGVLVGMPAAAGTVTGIARVVHDPATARLSPGEILVAVTTDPGWTPLFLTAGGLVTETGSPMAHGPTVAREYGIPAVICVPRATTLLDGRTVTVDGSSGTVRVAD
ncbi:PEP/pyruvate-binding domain-containing protein [Microlunatus parietis]|uniref:Pyruvate,water dikinase n=1 Tax=Microlunatus parietis TaxID=682979 RepID=A0A7Y9I445_9ACTN|nr:PEP/pyruvate-binding domain-containing protein [Microlunatus parietis]NYE69892.1 pyruvate,water dikinase [Microlunatus parietis]